MFSDINYPTGETKKYIKVMPDCGMLFWDWEGVGFGDADAFYYDDEEDWLKGFKMSDELKKDFHDWGEKDYQATENSAHGMPYVFDEDKIDEQGRELTNRLHNEISKVVNGVEVVYWKDTEEYKNRYCIKVMSDFTALFWDYSGVCIGDAGEDIDFLSIPITELMDFRMSGKLKKDFSEWHDEFERDGNKRPCPIDWSKYNARGRELTESLQAEIDKKVKGVEVVYEVPFENEN